MRCAHWKNFGYFEGVICPITKRINRALIIPIPNRLSANREFIMGFNSKKFIFICSFRYSCLIYRLKRDTMRENSYFRSLAHVAYTAHTDSMYERTFLHPIGIVSRMLLFEEFNTLNICLGLSSASGCSSVNLKAYTRYCRSLFFVI